jgi:RNA polymerase sigma factor (sigma-70 family)
VNPSPDQSPVPSSEIPQLAERLFRHEAGKLVSSLTGIFGMDRLQLAEDVVQEALVRALQTWPYSGIPENPAGWLMQTAKNRALDVIRREKFFHDKQPEIITSLEHWSSDPGDGHLPQFEDELKDDRLRLMFACCHPLIPSDDQTALALKTLCGFSPTEIAAAFLTTEPAIAKRLTRARQKIRDLGIPFEIPSGRELSPRLDGVLQTLYLLFNEGYKASRGDNLIREELCHEAIRLAALLAGHPSADQPRTHALIALMLLNASRLQSRTDAEGKMLRLKEQDRSTWDRMMIGKGLRHLQRAATGEDLSEYHLQAGIAACHATAPDYASTDWVRILAHYDQWTRINPSPVVALNRAVALAHVEGPEAGITAVQAIQKQGQLKSYYLVYAVLGEFETQLQHFQAAATHFQKALQLSEVKSEQSFLSKRLQDSEEDRSLTEPIISDF